jgi:hypothetical protein
MNKLLLILALSTAPAYAAPVEFNTTHFCDDYKKIINYTISEFGETALFKGIGFPIYYDNNGVKGETEAYMVFFVNQDTSTWSLIYAFGDGKACIIADGAEFEPY